ncbi:hypothetical protein Tco_1572593, partial [Tanacetum coccineum]
WCTAIAYDPNPPTDDSEVRPLKEYLIKFSMMNGKDPLTLDFKTFTKSTGLDYAKGKYVSYPSFKEVKSELAKIVDNPILLDRTHVLKTAFPVAWRILYTFVVQVLGTKVDIYEIIYSDLITKLTNKSRQKYVSYLRFVSCPLEVLLDSKYTQDKSFRSSHTILSNSNFSKDPSKVTYIKLTAFMVAVNNHEKSVAYHDICKYLMNCPLAKAFTKSPLVVYQNLLREFWCTVIASHPNPPVDDSEFHLLKEYLIKFLVMNGKNMCLIPLLKK